MAKTNTADLLRFNWTHQNINLMSGKLGFNSVTE